MPRYKNIGTTRVTVQGQVVDPGEIFESEIWYTEAMFGGAGSLLANAPMSNPTLLSEKVITDKTITVPVVDHNGNAVQKGLINIFVVSSEIEVTYSNAANTPVTVLYGGDNGRSWNVPFNGGQIKSISIKFNSGSLVYVTIENRS